MKTELQDRVMTAFNDYMSAREKAYKDLYEIVKSAGGFINTEPSNDKPTLYATAAFCGDECEYEPIFGIRIADGDIFICTQTSVSNFEYDNKYCFDGFGEYATQKDKKMMSKLLSNLTHFECLDNENYILSTTLVSILGGLQEYV